MSTPDGTESAAARFDPLRPALLRVAYRMLGSVADAEDVVQDAFLRWLDTDRDTVVIPEAYLRQVVTRLCLDVLKSARRRRETYVGAWLPEPVIATQDDPGLDDITLPLMLALERLSPLERAAFLLHDVFGAPFTEIAETIGRDPGACRQLAKRAREHLRAARPRYPVSRERGLEIAQAFFTASRQGDLTALRAMLSADVTIYADGGGKRPAVPGPVIGIEQVLAFQTRLACVFAATMSKMVQYGMIGGLPGFVTVEAGNTLQTTALQIARDRIDAIYVIRNPDKLRHLEHRP